MAYRIYFSFFHPLCNKEQANICKKYLKITNKKDCPSLRPQPGQISGFIDEYKPHPISCKKIEIRMKKDNPLIKKLKKNEECPNDFYKLEEEAQDILIKSAFSIDQYKKI